MRGGGGAGRVWGGGQDGTTDRKTGTLRKKQSWPSSIEYGGNGAHTTPTVWVMLFVSALHMHQLCYLYTGLEQQSDRSTCAEYKSTGRKCESFKCSGEQQRASCIAAYHHTPSLFLHWHVGPSIQLRQANHCAEREAFWIRLKSQSRHWEGLEPFQRPSAQVWKT